MRRPKMEQSLSAPKTQDLRHLRYMGSYHEQQNSQFNSSPHQGIVVKSRAFLPVIFFTCKRKVERDIRVD